MAKERPVEVDDAEHQSILANSEAEAKIARAAVKRAIEEDGFTRAEAEALYGLKGNASDGS